MRISGNSSQRIALDLGQRQQALKLHREHLPQTLLEFFGLGGFGHLVAADHTVRWQHLGHARLLELQTRDVRQHHAITIGKLEPAHVLMPLGIHQQRIALQDANHGLGVLPRLLQRVCHGLEARAQIERGRDRGQIADRVEPPIFHLKDQQSAARMQDHEVRVLMLRANGYVVPAEVIVFQQVGQPVGEAAFAGGGAGSGGGGAGKEGCHVLMLPGLAHVRRRGVHIVGARWGLR